MFVFAFRGVVNIVADFIDFVMFKNKTQLKSC